jgi:hypothetical protein
LAFPIYRRKPLYVEELAGDPQDPNRMIAAVLDLLCSQGSVNNRPHTLGDDVKNQETTHTQTQAHKNNLRRRCPPNPQKHKRLAAMCNQKRLQYAREDVTRLSRKVGNWHQWRMVRYVLQRWPMPAEL